MDVSALNVVWLHPVFEGIAYLVAGLLYRRGKKRFGDPLPTHDRSTVVVAAILGAAIGSKVLHHFASLGEFQTQLEQLGWSGIMPYLLGGKTIVGALLGGWIAVEVTKKRSGIVQRSGDLFALPLCAGIAVGRLGCFCAGPADDTIGVVTSCMFGVDYGDGVLRHPTPLYEIVFLIILGGLLVFQSRALAVGRPWHWLRRQGDAFRLFLITYFAFRFMIDFVKPYEVYAGLRIIQWACLFGILALLLGFPRRPKTVL